MPSWRFYIPHTRPMNQGWLAPLMVNGAESQRTYPIFYGDEGRVLNSSFYTLCESGVPQESYHHVPDSRNVRRLSKPTRKRAPSSYRERVKVDFTSIQGSISQPYSPYLQPAVLVDTLSKLHIETLRRSTGRSPQGNPVLNICEQPRLVPAHSATVIEPPLAPPTPVKETTAALIYEDYLYVGPMRAAINEAFLRKEGITDVLSVGVRCSPNLAFRVKGITYHEIPALLRLHDRGHSSILADEIIEKAGVIIEQVAKSRRVKPYYLRYLSLPQKKRKVLLHCAKGISRSPSIAIGYLIMFKNLSASEAYRIVKERRPIIRPRSNFCYQLTELDKIVHGSSVLGSL